MKKLFLFLLIAGLTATMACKGEQGDPGPAGVAGEDGRDGVNGQDGKDGNANVKSFTFKISSTSWYTDASGTYTFYEWGGPPLSKGMIDSGMVMVYVRGYLDPNWWVTLPYTVSNEFFTESFNYEMIYLFGPLLRLKIQATDGVLVKPNVTVRIVAAPPAMARLPNLDWTDYNAVKSALNLAEE